MVYGWSLKTQRPLVHCSTLAYHQLPQGSVTLLILSCPPGDGKSLGEGVGGAGSAPWGLLSSANNEPRKLTLTCALVSLIKGEIRQLLLSSTWKEEVGVQKQLMENQSLFGGALVGRALAQSHKDPGEMPSTTLSPSTQEVKAGSEVTLTRWIRGKALAKLDSLNLTPGTQVVEGKNPPPKLS